MISSISKIKDTDCPEINIISKMLTRTYSVTRGGFIQSNLIESKNSIVKRLINNIVLKSVYQYDHLLGTHYLARSDMDKCYWENFILEMKFNSELGFDQMLNFFNPDRKEIKVI